MIKIALLLTILVSLGFAQESTTPEPLVIVQPEDGSATPPPATRSAAASENISISGEITQYIVGTAGNYYGHNPNNFPVVYFSISGESFAFPIDGSYLSQKWFDLIQEVEKNGERIMVQSPADAKKYAVDAGKNAVWAGRMICSIYKF